MFIFNENNTIVKFEWHPGLTVLLLILLGLSIRAINIHIQKEHISLVNNYCNSIVFIDDIYYFSFILASRIDEKIADSKVVGCCQYGWWKAFKCLIVSSIWEVSCNELVFYKYWICKDCFSFITFKNYLQKFLFLEQ